MLIRVAFAIVAVLILVLVATYLVFMKGPDLSDYEHLSEPEITAKPDQKMLVVTARGDPNVVGGKAFGLLFRTYYRIEGAPRGPKQPAPRARWPEPLDTAPQDWVGHYGLPIPDDTTQVPEQPVEEGLDMTIATWRYGEVGEILHIGPYSEEMQTIERLKVFIDQSGYEIVGEHEEEYLRGPGMPFGVRPEDYYTIIRYRVRKLRS